MSNDKYEEFVSREKYVAGDKDEIEWVLGKVQQYAKEHDITMYVIRKNEFYYMTDEYYPVGKRIAIVYPGGRTEMGMAYERKNK